MVSMHLTSFKAVCLRVQNACAFPALSCPPRLRCQPAWKENRKTKISIQIANGTIQRIIINFYRVPFVISTLCSFFKHFFCGWVVGWIERLSLPTLPGDTCWIHYFLFTRICRVSSFSWLLAHCSNSNHVIPNGVHSQGLCRLWTLRRENKNGIISSAS